MLQFLGRLLAGDRAHPPLVRYLSRAEAEPEWREGRLMALDPQGAAFETRIDGRPVAECLPWGSIAAIHVPFSAPRHDETAQDTRRPDNPTRRGDRRNLVSDPPLPPWKRNDT